MRVANDYLLHLEKAFISNEMFPGMPLIGWVLYLLLFLITLSPDGPFTSNSFFRPKTKVAIIKTKSATIAFFFFASFPSPHSFFFFLLSFCFSLLWFWSFLGSRNVPFDAFSHKWLQISLGWFSKNRLDIDAECLISPKEDKLRKWRSHSVYSILRSAKSLSSRAFLSA